MQHTSRTQPTSTTRAEQRSRLRTLHLAAMLGIVALASAACGSSAPAAAKETPASAAVVKTICATSDALIGQLGTTLSNPGDAATAAFNAASSKLNAAAAVAVKANPAAAVGVSTCLQKVLTAMTAAGVASAAPAVTTKGGVATTVKGGSTAGGAAGFCKDVDALVVKLTAAAKDPAKANTAALSAEAQSLVLKAQATITADPGAAAAVQACVTKIGQALSGLAGGGAGGGVATTYAPSTSAASAATTAAGGGTADPAVATFCAQIDDLVVKYKAAMTDPSKAGDLAALSAQMSTLAAQAGTLAAAGPGNATAVAACLQKLSTIGG